MTENALDDNEWGDLVVGEAEDEDETSRLIANTNKLLVDVGIAAKKIKSKQELARLAPSVFVAVFEALYHARIDGIIRKPTSNEDYEHNAQLVIDNLSDQINIDLTHISGKAIVNGDFRALSNLVHIFMRIVSLAASRESLSTIESAEEDFDDLGLKRRLTNNDSISTKDSLLEQMKEEFPHGISPKKSAEVATPSRSARKTPTSTPGKRQPDQEKLLRSFIDKSLHKVDRQLDFELKQHRAARRRKTLTYIRRSRSSQQNSQAQHIAMLAKHRKALQDLNLNQRSFELKKTNEDVVQLRSVYNALYKEEIKLRVDEERLLRKQQEYARENVANHIENMERLFKERLEILREQNPRENDKSTNIEVLEKIIRGVDTKHKELFEKSVDLAAQERQRALLWRCESYADIKALLKAEKWSDSLRSYPPEEMKKKEASLRRKHLAAPTAKGSMGSPATKKQRRPLSAPVHRYGGL